MVVFAPFNRENLIISYLNLTDGLTDMQAKPRGVGNADLRYYSSRSLKYHNGKLYLPLSYHTEQNKKKAWVGYVEFEMKKVWRKKVIV